MENQSITQEKETSQQNNSILSILSHDLRSPINAIIGFSNLAERLPENSENEALIKYISIICKEAEYANALINSLSKWGKNLQKDFSPKEETEIMQILETAKKERVNSLTKW